MEPTADGWDRIAAESELRPHHGPVTAVPGEITTAQLHRPETVPARPPIQAHQVPASPVSPVEPPEPAQPILQVPYEAEPTPVETVEVIADTPLEVAATPSEEPAVLVTEVPDIPADPAAQPALPDNGLHPASTSWWRLMLGWGGRRQASD